MRDSVDRILDLIDEGLLDAERQHTTEPAMMLDDAATPTYYARRRDGVDFGAAVHVCVPACRENAHIASGWLASNPELSFSERAMDAYAERLAEMVALDAETVYVRLHTHSRTPDTPVETFVSRGEGYARSGDSLVWSPATFVWMAERCADESD